MKSKIYTKTGDGGETSLLSGNRVSKSSPRLDLYGEVDHLNSQVGLLVSSLEKQKIFLPMMSFLESIQSELFNLGSLLACEDEMRSKYKLPAIRLETIQNMERLIDEMDSGLIPLKNFILPGGSEAAAMAHLCRTQCRRVERLLIKFEMDLSEPCPENSKVFINRLSDYFFVAARSINSSLKVSDKVWISR